CLPNLLPGGRPVADASARIDVASAWGVPSLAAGRGLSSAEQFEAAARGDLKALVIAGVDPLDHPDAATALAGIEAAQFVISIEQRASAVSERANVVFPAAVIEEQTGHFLNWELRERPVALVNDEPRN